MYIVLLGPPGAGKGTQAKRLAEQLNVPHVSTGDLFRAMKTEDTPLARKVQEIMAAGKLVDDQTTWEIAKERLERPDSKGHGAILDGFPRNEVQANLLKEWLALQDNQIDLVLLMDVPRDVAIERIIERKKKEGRTDDSREVAEERYEVYLQETAQLVPYYEALGLLETINGDQVMDAVTRDLVSAIRQRQQTGAK